MLQYIMADKSNIEQLVKMRIDYIRADQGNISTDNENEMRHKLPSYFERHLGKDLFSFVARNDGIIVAAAFLLIIEKPSNPHFINGRVGEVLNVYTSPEYRHQGISTRLMNELISFSKNNNLDYIELSATNDGYPLYKKLGFTDHESQYSEMRLIC